MAAMLELCRTLPIGLWSHGPLHRRLLALPGSAGHPERIALRDQQRPCSASNGPCGGHCNAGAQIRCTPGAGTAQRADA